MAQATWRKLTLTAVFGEGWVWVRRKLEVETQAGSF